MIEKQTKKGGPARKILCIGAVLVVLAGLVVVLNPAKTSLAVHGLDGEAVSAAIADYDGEGNFYRRYLIPEETEYLIDALKGAALERISEEKHAELE